MRIGFVMHASSMWCTMAKSRWFHSGQGELVSLSELRVRKGVSKVEKGQWVGEGSEEIAKGRSRERRRRKEERKVGRRSNFGGEAGGR